jgi:hypothetical protein
MLHFSSVWCDLLGSILFYLYNKVVYVRIVLQLQDALLLLSSLL